MLQTSIAGQAVSKHICSLPHVHRASIRPVVTRPTPAAIVQQHRCQRLQAEASSNGGPAGDSQLNWFDRLPPRVQYGALIALAVVGIVVVPFLQPTFLYSSSNSSTTQVTTVVPTEEDYSHLPKPLLWLQSQVMPRTLPDGRSESPGVLRIYMASMIILAAFYACSFVMGGIFRVVGAALKAVGITGAPKQ